MRLQIVLLEPFQNQILAALMRGVRMATNVDVFEVRYDTSIFDILVVSCFEALSLRMH
jgi:hypothetical protein